MSNIGTDIDYLRINSKNIIVEPVRQREIRQDWVDAIVKNFDPKRVNPIKVAFRNGRYYCFDGQHTLAALRAKNNGHHILVPCMVYKGLTEYEQAELFEEQDAGRHRVSTVEKFRSKFNRGDPKIIDMVRIAESMGLIIDFKQNVGPKRIVALSKLFKVYSETSRDEFISILDIIKSAWSEHDDAFRREILGGIMLFVKTYQTQFDREYFIRKLKKKTPAIVVRDGNVSSASGDRKYAVQFVNIYNYSRTKNRLADRL